MAALYRTSTAVLSVAQTDATPVAMFEAMAAGAVFVATDLPSIREWITHDRNGVLVPVRDHVPLAEGILGVLRDGSRRRRFTAENARLVAHHGDFHRNMAYVADLYRQALQVE